MVLLFFIVWIVDKWEVVGKSIVKNLVIYVLFMVVYCMAWMFYGSVGWVVIIGLGFLLIYFGLVLLVLVWWLLFKKIIFISKF